MPRKSRTKVKRLLLSRMKKLVDEKTLKNKIDDFVDEYLEKCKFLEKYTIEDLPSHQDIKWWFQEKPKKEYIKHKNGEKEFLYEVNIDSICLNDNLATEVFKHYYCWFWEKNKKLPSIIDDITEVYKKYTRARTEKSKNKHHERLSNISLIGAIRLNGLERQPYLSETQIIDSTCYLLDCLEVLKTVGTKKEPDDWDGKLYIFNKII